jgi:demethylmenaquinone methyltransferase/2-methoxy-6-polyprenyl-1,4-benzoquinol methylase
MQDIYDSKYVEELFDNMSGSYDRMNYITSFGFSSLWRKQCIKDLDLSNSKIIIDLMAGMGECWKPIAKKAPQNAELIALDFSGEMVKHAKNRIPKIKMDKITVLKEDVFNNSIETELADCVISGFGLKTFSPAQLDALPKQIERILKPNGQFSLIDVSVPKGKVLKFFYLFYLKRVIPLLGWMFLGNPSTYKMLGVYTENFQNAKEVKRIFEKHNFEVEYIEYFFGCASGIKGKKLGTSTKVH